MCVRVWMRLRCVDARACVDVLCGRVRARVCGCKCTRANEKYTHVKRREEKHKNEPEQVDTGDVAMKTQEQERH